MDEKFCPSCGTKQPEEVKFCKSCGYNFSEDEPEQKPIATESKIDEPDLKVEEPIQNVIDEEHIYDESEEDVSEPVKKPRKKSGFRKVIAGIIGLIALIALVIFYILPKFFPEYALDIFEEEPEPLAIAGTYYDQEGLEIEINDSGRANIKLGDPADDIVVEIDFNLRELDEDTLPFSFEEMLLAAGETEYLEKLNFDANPEYTLYISDRQSDHHMEVSMPTSTLSDGSVDALPEFMEFFDSFDFDREIEDGRVTYSGNYQPSEMLKKENLKDMNPIFALGQMYLYYQGELHALQFVSYAGEGILLE